MEIDAQELYRSPEEDKLRTGLVGLFKECPIPDADILQNLGLFLNSKNLGRLLFMNHLYQLSLNVHGTVMEFGTRWGQNMALFASLRALYEPYNRMRQIVGFDTFEGFPSLDGEKDNLTCDIMKVGGLACTKDYDKYLDSIMQYHQRDNPMSHVKRYEICKGDATLELTNYLDRNPETIVSLAFFDFDIYKPTKDCLELIKPRLVKGSVIGWDELNDHDSPGETIALQEVFGMNNIRLQRLPFVSRVSYFVVE